jgi:hypothetical protein
MEIIFVLISSLTRNISEELVLHVPGELAMVSDCVLMKVVMFPD